MKRNAIEIQTLEKHPLLLNGAFEMVISNLKTFPSKEVFIDQYNLMRVNFVDDISHFGTKKYAGIVERLEEQGDKLILSIYFDYANTSHQEIFSRYSKKKIGFCGVAKDGSYVGSSSYWEGLANVSDSAIVFGKFLNALYYK